MGAALAEQLGYAYYDQEIIREIANRTALSERYVQQIVEHRPVTSFPIHTGRSFMMMYDPLMEQNQSIFRGQCEILQQMAEKSDCVIVGRCADYILRDRNPLRIFIYAEMSSKLQRCRTKVHETGRTRSCASRSCGSIRIVPIIMNIIPARNGAPGRATTCA